MIRPHVTIGAMLTGVASAVASLAPHVALLAPLLPYVFGDHAEAVGAAAPAVALVATIVAGLGASPLSKRSSSPMSFFAPLAEAVLSEAAANEPAALAALVPLNTKAADALVAFVSAKNPMFGALVAQFAPQAIAALGGEEKVLLNLAIADGKAWAASL